MMTVAPPLERLTHFLQALTYEVGYLEPSAEQPYGRVIVALDEDRSKAEYEDVVQIFFMEDVLQAANQQATEQSDEAAEDPSNLQIVMDMPLQLQGLPNAQKSEAYRLIFILNKLLPLGSLGLQHENEALYFKYSLLGKDQNHAADLIGDILDMMAFYLPEFKVLIQQALSGKPLQEILAESGLMKALQAEAA